MKALSDVMNDMSTLYDELRSGAIELKMAAELANISGKYLKAKQLELATEIFLSHRNSPALQASNGTVLIGETLHS